MKTAVIIFPGSNCDRDMIDALHQATGKAPYKIWHADHVLPEGLDFIAVPGGFSYGDYLRSGAIAAHSPIMKEVAKAANRGVYVLGVCNGFQVLTETGLLPGVLMRNRDLRFVCKDVELQAANTNTVFTSQCNKIARIPVAHHDGNYFVSDDGLKTLKDNDQIAFHYVNNTNPNGSVADIAGVFNTKKNVLGMMPHPERAVDKETGGLDGKALFDSLIAGVS